MAPWRPFKRKKNRRYRALLQAPHKRYETTEGNFGIVPTLNFKFVSNYFMTFLNLYTFREIDESQDLHIPEILKNRKCTDIFYLIYFIVTILMTMILALIICLTKSDYNRFLHGYDSCGDTCGSSNLAILSNNCSGKNLTTKPIMKYQFIEHGKQYLLPDECVDECKPPDRLLFHRCIPKNDRPVETNGNRILTFLEFVDDLQKSGVILIVPMCVLGGVLSLGLFLCFNFSSRTTVIVILVLSPICFMGFTGYVWYCYAKNIQDNTFLYVGILMTILSFFLCVFTCYFHVQYPLVIEMFIEATKVTFAVPSLIFVPIIAFSVLTIVVTGAVVLICILSTNQDFELHPIFPEFSDFQITDLAQFEIAYLCLTMIWIFAFTNACQCFIVAGPVSQHYFQNEDTDLRHSVVRSVSTLLRYHLGSIAFGSLCVTLLTGIRIALEVLEKSRKSHRPMLCLKYFITCLEPIVEYLTKKAYILTAMHGSPLFKSGKRAARLIWTNLMDTLSIDVAADFIIICAMSLVMLIALVIAFATYWVSSLELNYVWTVLAFGVGIVGTIIYFFLQIINVSVSIETIFLCFCEDKLLNDGITRPYKMSPRLKLLVEKAKKAARNNNVQFQ